jgi:predicted alpha/beta-hydrolase family hydrolase
MRDHFWGVKNQQPGETVLEAADRVQREVKAYQASRPERVKRVNALQKKGRLKTVMAHNFKKYAALMPVGTEVVTKRGGMGGRVVSVSFADVHAPQLYVFFYKTGSVGKVRADHCMVSAD